MFCVISKIFYQKALLLYLARKEERSGGMSPDAFCYSDKIPHIKKSIPKAKEAAAIFASFLSNGLRFSNIEKNMPPCLITLFTPIMARQKADITHDNSPITYLK